MGSVPQNRPATALLAKGSTENPRTKAAAESAVRPAKEARRKSARQANRSPPRGSASPEIHTPKRRQRAFCFVESPENARPSSGFSASKPVRRGSSNGMVLPGKSAEPVGAHPAVAFRRGNTRRVRESFAPRGWTILRSVESSGVRSSSGFSVSKPVRRGSSNGMVLPGKSAEPVGAHPTVAFSSGSHALGAGETRAAGKTILRSVESSGVRSSSGFSASKPVRHGSSSGRSSPGSRAPERRQRAFRFVESPESARQSSGFSASKPVRRGSSSGRSSPGRRAPERRQRAFCFVESPENARQSSGFSVSKPGRRGSSRGRVSPGRSAPK